MKAMYVSLAAMTIALAACSGSDKSQLGDDRSQLGDLPVVAHSVEVNGQEMTVCELDLLKDTIDLPLSYWVEDFQAVKLDGKDEALVGQGPICVSDNYILVGRANNVPCKLFRKDGSFVGSVGSIGQGPGEYTMVYDMQIDEKAGHIYLLPWNAKSIFVYDMNGKYMKDIPLNKKYEKLIVPKGKFKVDAEKNRVAMMLLPFDYLPVVAWIQDMEGNVIHEIPMNHLKVKPDFSNEVYSSKVSGNTLDIFLLTFWELRKDTLYHLNMESGKFQPKFTLDFGQRKICIHDYHEFPGHYVGALSNPVQVGDRMYETEGESFFMVEKTTKRGTFFRVGNDFLDNEPIKYMPFHCSNGYYTLNIEPSVLKEKLEKELKDNSNINETKRKNMQRFISNIDEDENNYIFIGKLRENFVNPLNINDTISGIDNFLKPTGETDLKEKREENKVIDIRAPYAKGWGEYLRKNNRYKDWEGEPCIVLVGATVDKEGHLTDIRVTKRVGNEELNKEALRLVKGIEKIMPAIDKATGESIECKNFALPVHFPAK